MSWGSYLAYADMLRERYDDSLAIFAQPLEKV